MYPNIFVLILISISIILDQSGTLLLRFIAKEQISFAHKKSGISVLKNDPTIKLEKYSMFQFSLTLWVYKF